MYTERQYYEELEQHQIWSSNQKDNGALNIICSDLLPNMQAVDTSKIFVDYNHKDILDIKTINKVALWGSLYNNLTARSLKFAVDNKIPIEIWENGFIRSVKGWSVNQDKYTNGYSFIKGVIPYFNTISLVKNNILKDIEDYECTKADIKLARKCIDYIVKNELTKYNHQGNVELKPTDLRKLLLIDQSYKDMSIHKGQANEQSFIKMVQDALNVPYSKLYLKLHPDTISGDRKGYFGLKEIQDLIDKNKDRIELIDYESNPINTIKQVDEIYCVTSQFGFEALMCGKLVHCYGRPVYSSVIEGNISIEEFFYIMYVKNTMWVDPYHKQTTDILDFLKKFNKLLAEYKKGNK